MKISSFYNPFVGWLISTIVLVGITFLVLFSIANAAEGIETVDVSKRAKEETAFNVANSKIIEHINKVVPAENKNHDGDGEQLVNDESSTENSSDIIAENYDDEEYIENLDADDENSTDNNNTDTQIPELPAASNFNNDIVNDLSNDDVNKITLPPTEEDVVVFGRPEYAEGMAIILINNGYAVDDVRTQLIEAGRADIIVDPIGRYTQNWTLVHFLEDESVYDMIDFLNTIPAVGYAQPNFYYYLES